MTVEEQIYAHSVSSPDKTAIVDGDSKITYAQLWRNILNAASYYAAMGLQSRDRVVVSATKSRDFIYAYFGAHMAGLICVPIDAETNPTRLARILECAKPALIVGELNAREGLEVHPFGELVQERGLESLDFPDVDAVADILFTTGTTGAPKGVALSFSNRYATAESINRFIGNDGDDIELLALPVSHSFGLGRISCTLLKGGTLVLLNGFASMKKFFGAIEKHRVTGFGMVPSGWAYIKKMSGERIGKYANQLKYIEIGSAYMPPSEKAKLLELLPHTRICMHYGLTEASRSSFLCFSEAGDKLSSAGRPSPGVEIAVFDEEGKMLGTNRDGEICVYGPNVCVDYWGMPKEEFEKDFNGTYFKTGDWGHIDDKGYLHLVSRKKEMINVGGKKVSPLEVEEVINSQDGIVESACIGVADAMMGEVVKAFVVCDRDIDPAALKAKLSASLENYKVPAYIEVIDALPKTASGKLQRLLLKDK